MIATDKLQFKILAPALSGVPRLFSRPAVDARTHNNLIFGVQLLRGLALRECGQMASKLTADGRHVQPTDYDSWHVLLLNGEEQILGCARYRPLQGGPDDFGASQSALAQTHRYGPILRNAIERLIANAKTRGKQYGECGGWALRREVRGTTAAVNIALMTFALAENLNSGLAVTTATTNNHSADILCRIGARRVADLPAYYEPKYGSTIELLEFRTANPRYLAKLEKLRAETLQIPVICGMDNNVIKSPAPEHVYSPMQVAPLFSETPAVSAIQ